MSSNPIAGSRPAEVLVVEDNDNDVEIMKVAFRRARFAVNLHVVGDGEQCMAFLRKQGRYAGTPMPDLILLDLNMPRMDGREVLVEVGKDDALKHLPIVVMTSSDAEKDVLSSYQLRCSSYVVKPLDFARFSTIIQSLADYWFTLVVLPTVAPRSGKPADGQAGAKP